MTITVNHVSFSYGLEGEKILKDIFLTLDEFRPVAVLGPSGIGKTTLLRVIAGLEKGISGEVIGITKDTRLGILYQEDRLFPELSIEKNWRLVNPLLTEKDLLTMAEKLLLTQEDLRKRPGELSGGMRRRAAIGRCLLFPCDVYLMDEPIQGLDEESRLAALQAIREKTTGKPLLLITHREEDAAFLNAKVYHLI